MADLTQKVKYTVEVDLTQLNALQDALKAADTSAKALDTSLASMSKTITTGGLGKALRSMSGTFGAMGTNMSKIPFDGAQAGFTRLAEAAAKMQASVGDFARDMRAVAQASKVVQKEITQQATETKKLGEATDRSFRFLKVFGTFQALRFTAQQVFQGIKEGAQQLDLDNILSRQFSNFREEIAKAQDLTAGTVGRGALTKSYALMSSFGIPMDQFAENMELVQKMAVRTGQSADFLTESFARGISRLSPLILDNLGIQVSLSDANQEYAVATGKLTTELTKEERVAALLQHTLRKLRENTEGVSLSADSAAASVSRFETALGDVWLWVKQKGGEAIQILDKVFQSQRSDVKDMAARLEEALAFTKDLRKGGLMGALPSELENSKQALDVIARTFPDLAERADEYTASVNDVASAMLYARTIAYERGVSGGNSTLADSMGFGSVGASQMADFGNALEIIMAQQRALQTGGRDVLAAYADVLPIADRLAAVEVARNFAMQQSITQLGLAKALMEAHGLSAEEALRTVSEMPVQAGLYATILETVLSNMKSAADMNEIAVDGIEKEIEGKRTAIQHAETLAKIREGDLLSEIERQRVSREIEQVMREIADAEEAWAVAKKEGRGKEEAAALRAAYDRMAALDEERRRWDEKVRAEERYFDYWKEQSKEQRMAEVGRLMILKEQLSEIEAQQRALRDILTTSVLLENSWWGKGPMAAPETFETRVAETEARIKRMLDMADRSGGGRGGREPKEQVFDYDAFVPDTERLRDIVDKNKKAFAYLREQLWPAVDGMTESLMRTPDELADVENKYYDIIRLIERMRATFGDEYTDALLLNASPETARILREQADAIEKLRKEYEKLFKLTSDIRSFSESLNQFHAGMSSIHGDLFGGEFISMVSDLSNAFQGLATTLEKNAAATDKSNNSYNTVLASLPILRSFTQNLIKDRRDQAKVEMLMQAAAAWAAWAIPNPAKAIAHMTAATLYAAVGFGAVKLPSGKPRDTTPKEGRGSSGGEVRRPDIHIYLQGTLVQTEAERGVLAQHAIAEARRRGML